MSLPFNVNKDVWAYWKKSTFIVLMTFFLIAGALIQVYFNYNPEITFFATYVESSQLITSIGSIGSILGFVGAYLYLLFYIEQHNAFIFQENTKEAKISTAVYMLFRLANYCVPILIIGLVLIPKAYVQAGILVAILLITTFIFKSITEDFAKILNNYKALESLEPANLLEPLGKSREKAKDDLKEQINKIKTKTYAGSSIRELLKPYLVYIPAIVSGVILIIVKKGGPHLKNSMMALTFLTIFIALPAHFNILVVAYMVLTLIFWFWTVSVVFAGFPQSKERISLKNKTIYSNVYKIEDNPKGYCLFLNEENKLLTIKKDEIEREELNLQTNGKNVTAKTIT